MTPLTFAPMPGRTQFSKTSHIGLDWLRYEYYGPLKLFHRSIWEFEQPDDPAQQLRITTRSGTKIVPRSMSETDLGSIPAWPPLARFYVPPDEYPAAYVPHDDLYNQPWLPEADVSSADQPHIVTPGPQPGTVWVHRSRIDTWLREWVLDLSFLAYGKEHAKQAEVIYDAVKLAGWYLWNKHQDGRPKELCGPQPAMRT